MLSVVVRTVIVFAVMLSVIRPVSAAVVMSVVVRTVTVFTQSCCQWLSEQCLYTVMLSVVVRTVIVFTQSCCQWLSEW